MIEKNTYHPAPNKKGFSDYLEYSNILFLKSNLTKSVVST